MAKDILRREEADDKAILDILDTDPEDIVGDDLPEAIDDPDEDEAGDAVRGSGNSENDTAADDETDRLMKELSGAEKGFKNAQRFLIYLAILLVVLWVLFFKVIGITHMPSEDMTPRIDAGDLIIFYRLDRSPKFQDVVVFEKDIDGTGTKTMMIGRVMAVPGDTVDITAGNHIAVNGNSIVEPMIYTPTPKREDRVAYPLTMGEEQYFILVDNRTDGMDSRYFGPVSKDEILGMVITLIRRTKL